MLHNPMLRRRKNVFQGLFALALTVALTLSAMYAPIVRAAAAIFVRTDGSDTLCNGTVDGPASSAPTCAFATIQKGVTGVDVGGTVNVRAGMYNENVQINKTVTLRGAQAGVDARTRPGTPASESMIANAIAVNANNVAIDGFTIQGGDNSGGDLGTGIYLVSTSSGYQIRNNIVQNNVFGLYLNSGGATQTLVQHNLFKNNNLPGPASGDAIYSDQGLINALIDGNAFVGNPDAAFDFSRTDPPAQSNITITNNSIVGGTRPFILLNMTSTVIANNTIANASSPALAAFRIYGGVSGLAITGNAIVNGTGRAVLISDNFPTPHTNANISVHFNRIVGNAVGGIAIQGGYSGTLNAENNWWGCNGGPGVAGCDTIGAGVDANPWLTLKLTAAPNTIFVGSSSTLTADLTINSNGVDTSALGQLLDGTPVAFGGALGSVAPANTGTLGGTAQSIYTAGATPGGGNATAQVDNQSVATPITITPKSNSATTVTFSSNPAVYGQTITFTAAVSAVPAGPGMPTGTVTFKEGATILGASALNGLGQATLSTTQLGVGSHTITAFYGGSAGFNPSDTTGAPLSQTIAKAATTTVTSAAPDPSLIGRAVTVQFSVTANPPGSGTPTGSITVSASGASCVGTLNGGAGSCSITLSSIGAVTLTATYGGDDNFNGSAGTTMHEVVYFKTYLPLIER